MRGFLFNSTFRRIVFLWLFSHTTPTISIKAFHVLLPKSPVIPVFFYLPTCPPLALRPLCIHIFHWLYQPFMKTAGGMGHEERRKHLFTVYPSFHYFLPVIFLTIFFFVPHTSRLPILILALCLFFPPFTFRKRRWSCHGNCKLSASYLLPGPQRQKGKEMGKRRVLHYRVKSAFSFK